MFSKEFPSFPVSLLGAIDPTTIVEHGTFYRSPDKVMVAVFIASCE